MSAAEIARHLGVATSNITSAIEKIEKSPGEREGKCNVGNNVPNSFFCAELFFLHHASHARR
ncbi:MAG: hypothetical protein ACFFCW_44925 [Candidatus Hodarchaeota archaeon]